MVAFQAVDPGSIPGRRMLFFSESDIQPNWNMAVHLCLIILLLRTSVIGVNLNCLLEWFIV